MPKKFPKGFLWGASTSAHQVEGGNHNDWTEWEQTNADRLAEEASGKFKRLPNWHDVADQATDPVNYISGRAADHWNRYEEDFDLMKELGMNAYRFSIEWSRIEPHEGEFDQVAIEHYQNMIVALKKRGIEPFVTLWHWTLPLWLSRRGGWLADDAVERFAIYATKAAGSFGNVRFWTTMNEPDSFSSVSYFTGDWPPQSKNLLKYLRVQRQLFRGHLAAYRAIKKAAPKAQIGIVVSLPWLEAGTISPLDHLMARLGSWWADRHILNAVDNHLDFVGLNYYFHNRIKNGRVNNEDAVVSDLGWEVLPEGIYHVVMDAYHRYGKPVYVTENGLADAQDLHRPWFVRESLSQLHRAITDGADVRGYMHWSLLDNFEWDKGFWPRFGLVEVDFRSQKRTIRPSAKVYSEIIKRNALD